MALTGHVGTDGWKVRVEQSPFMVRTNFYVWRPGDSTGFSEHMGSDGVITRVPHGTAMEIAPTFTLGGFEIHTVMNALAEALAEQGVKTPNDHVLQGRLDAQTAHLNDLRTLLKLDKNKSGDKRNG